MRRVALFTLASALCLFALAPAGALAVPPTIPKTTISSPTTTSIVLEADVNPEKKATFVHFEYGSADCASNPCAQVPEDEENIGSGATPVRVKTTLEGLTPGTTYHFRAIARHPSEGAAGEVEGPDRVFSTFALPPVFAPCPNDALRIGPGVELPDCRAFEQASPIDKNAAFVTGTISLTRAADDGDGVTFISDSGIPGGEGAQDLPTFLSSRSASGWSTQGVLPSAAATNGQDARVAGWLPDFSVFFDEARRITNPPSVTFLARQSEGGALATLAPYSDSTSHTQESFAYVGASPDGATVYFDARTVPLTGNASPDESNLYAWDRDSGTLTLAGVMNGGTAPPGGSFAGPYDWANASNTPAAGRLTHGGAELGYYLQDSRTVSPDGSAVYFTAGGTGQLYLRLNPTEPQSAFTVNGQGEEECTEPAKACTIKVSATEKDNGNGPDGADAGGTRPAVFHAASADGTVAYFTSSEKLTNDAYTGPEADGAPAIARAELDGEGPPSNIDFNFLPQRATALAVDATHLYWFDPENHAIGKADISSGVPTEVENELIPGIETKSIAVHGEYVYWTSVNDSVDGHGTISRARLDGSEVKPDFITGASRPLGVAVNDTHVYWGDNPTSQNSFPLMRADINGDGAEVFGNRNARYMTLTDTRIYHTGQDPESFPQKLDYITSLSLTDPQDGEGFAGNNKLSPQGIYRGIAVDDTYVYWASPDQDGIGQVGLDGQCTTGCRPDLLDGFNIEPAFIRPAGHPLGLANDGTYLYWSANQEAFPNQGNDLYRFDATKPPGQRLTDLTPEPAAKYGAEVRAVLGTSADGSYVYFSANGVLTDTPNSRGEIAEPGDCKPTTSGTESGVCNLYLWHDGEIEFIARGAGPSNWTPYLVSASNQKTSRVSPDGRTLLFSATAQLTEYDSEGVVEFYRYRAPGGELLCVTCNPTGAAPPVNDDLGPFLAGPRLGRLVPVALTPRTPASVLSRNLSADGNRVFFETPEKLVAADTDGDVSCEKIGGYLQFGLYFACVDVYQWEAPGTGSCQSAAQNGGCLYLLSTGRGNDISLFADGSASGDDVFLISLDQLVGQDKDQLRDVYDLRVGGGLASQHPVPKVPCEKEGCKPGASTAPSSESAGTANFVGPPNPKAKKGKAKHKKRKHSNRKHKKQKRHQRRAHQDRRAQR